MNTLILALLLVVTAAAFNSGNGGGRFDSLSSWSLEEGGRFRPPSRPRPPGQPRPPGWPRPWPPGRPRLPTTGCPTGWMRFERPQGVWCVMVGHSTTANGFLSQAEAEAVCVRHGAVLTGFQNDKYSCGKRGTPEGMNIFLHFKNF
ncbi:unnamed protein product [Caenorhabditis nigoni]